MDRATKAAELTATINDGVLALVPLQLGFVAFCTYVAITIWNITDQQLIVPESVRLLLVDAELPVKGFFLVVPWLIVVLHFYASIQLASLARKAWSFERTVGDTRSLQHYRELLSVSPFAQFFSGKYQTLSSVVVTGTFLIVPLLVLSSIQIRFLCFHSEFVTWVHRLAVLADCAVSIWLWPSLLTKTGLAGDWWRETLRRIRVWKRGGGTMADAAPVGQRIWLGLIYITACLLTTAVSIVALVPQSNEPATDLSLERLLTIGSHPPVPPGSSEGAVSVTLVPTMWLFEMESAPFTRSIRSPGLSPSPHVDREPTESGRVFVKALELVGSHLVHVDLTRRDLRYADLSEGRLPGATLVGAKLFGVNFFHADLRLANLMSADLRMSVLTGARLEGANLQGTDLSSARLDGTDLGEAKLIGAIMKNRAPTIQ